MPTWLRRILLFVVLPLLFLMGLGKWYITKTINTGLEQAAMQLSELGTLSYSDANYTWLGDIVILDFEFSPRGGGGTFFSKEIRLEIKNTQGGSIIFGDSRPGSGTILLTGIDMTLLTGSLGRNSMSGNPMEAEACGDINYFTSGDLIKMGFDEVETDLKLVFSLSPENGQTSFELTATTHPLSKLTTVLEFSFPPVAPQKFSSYDLLKAQLSHFDATFEDLGFVKKRNRFCADKVDSTTTDYIAQHSHDAQQWLQKYRLKMGQDTLSVYKQFQQNKQSKLSFISNPRPVSLQDISNLSLRGWLKTLNLQVSINNSRPVSFKLLRVKESQQDQKLNPDQQKENATLDANQQDILKTNINQPKRLTLSKLKEIKKPELPQYIDKKIRIYSANGNFHEGILVKVLDSKIIINVRRGAGFATYPIKLSKIRKIEELK
ncbi:MAG: hypothetical protein ACWA5R_02700 [bacterium]